MAAAPCQTIQFSAVDSFDSTGMSEALAPVPKEDDTLALVLLALEGAEESLSLVAVAGKCIVKVVGGGGGEEAGAVAGAGAGAGAATAAAGPAAVTPASAAHVAAVGCQHLHDLIFNNGVCVVGCAWAPLRGVGV